MLLHDPYYDVKAVSNSSLRYINPDQEGSPVLFKEHWDGKAPSLKTSSLEFGNLVHLAALEPHLCNYIVDETNTPDKIRDILKDAFASLKDSLELKAAITGEDTTIKALDEHIYVIIEACDRQAYGRTWKPETRINKVMSAGSAYWDLLRSSDKFIITQKQLDSLNSCMNSLENTSPELTELLFRKVDNGNMSYFNELEVYWEDPRYNFPLKAKIDRLHLNHRKKQFSIIDLKTTGKTLGMFPASFKTYHYSRQIAAYEEAAYRWILKNYGEEYTPEDHCICAVESRGAHRAGTFYIADETLKEGKDELQSLLQRLNYHFTHGSWVQEMEAETKTKIFL